MKLQWHITLAVDFEQCKERNLSVPSFKDHEWLSKNKSVETHEEKFTYMRYNNGTRRVNFANAKENFTVLDVLFHRRQIQFLKKSMVLEFEW